MLDSLADEQVRDKPSQRGTTEDIDTERSIFPISRATESTTSPTDGHAPIAEAQGSQQESTGSDLQGRFNEVTSQSQASTGDVLTQGNVRANPLSPDCNLHSH